MLVEKRDEKVLAKPFGGIRSPFEGTQRICVAVRLSMMPRAENEVRVAVIGSLDRVKYRRSAVDIFLVPLAVDEKAWER